MHTWQAAALGLILLTPGVCSCAVPAQPIATTNLLERVRQKYGFPGLACAVIKDGQLAEIAAVGIRKEGEAAPLTSTDVFHIGSCTKSMTATVAAMLIEKGDLKWGTTVGDIFPELKSKIDPAFEAVTLEQLLTHRSGLSEKPPAAAWQRAWERHGSPTEQRYEFVSAVLRSKPEATPGKRYIYSNQGYAVAGAMLERKTGTAYEELMVQRLFKPLQMDSAGFGPPGTKGMVDQPWGHVRRGEEIVALQEDNPPAIAPAGTVHCSLGDLAKYCLLHLDGERSGKMLTRDTFRKLHRPAGDDYACGWICVQRDWSGGTALTHNGSNTMWYVVIWLAPAKRFGVIVGTNTGAGDTFHGCDEVAAEVISHWRKSGG